MSRVKNKQNNLETLIKHCKENREIFEAYASYSPVEKVKLRNQIANIGIEMTPSELDELIQLAYECLDH